MNQFDVNVLLRENIKNMKPYSSARDEYTGEAKIFIDANENPFGSADKSKNNRYPDPYQLRLKEKIASIKHVQVEQIFLGNGSDEAIDLLYKAFCYPYKDKVIITPPTYGMYEVSAETNGNEVVKIPLTPDFNLIVDDILKENKPENKLLFLCTPNNPSGNNLKTKDIETLLKEFKGIVVVDEAYIDFADRKSWTERLSEFPNLVVLQTLSKAWGMANLRLGMMFASTEIISIMNKIKLPYNLNGLVQDVVSEILDNEKEKNAMVDEILQERKRLVDILSRNKEVLHIYPSDANFLLAKVTNPKDIYSYLLDKGIVVRDRSSQLHCEGCLRITVGTKSENDLLIKAFNEY